ncbi:MAG: SPOR domain-containing protein [Proteobacteria bacterium]|nr:SPOR domain-containing protein [Pseudomonadota bacterium]
MVNLLCTQALRALAAVIFVILVFIVIESSPVRAAEPSVSTGRYAINLASYAEEIDTERLPRAEALKKYRLYTTRHKEDGKEWYRLRLGFFIDAKSAKKVMKTLRMHYPEAWVARVTDGEWSRSRKMSIRVAGGASIAKKAAKKAVKKSSVKMSVAAKSATGGTKTISKKRLGAIMESAEEAMTKGKYRLAAELYTKVLEYKGHKFSEEARELLGLAYERSNRGAHARAEYRAYLMLYPKGDGAKRVRQRLAGLETARAKPKKKLRKRKVAKPSTQVYGSFSQFYNRDESYTDLGGNVVTNSSVSNDFDISYRKRTPEYELSSVLIAGYELDLLGSAENVSRISRLYVDMLDRRLHLSGRLGRQSRSTGGVLGRFDGALVSYQYFPRVKFNVVAGYPVETSALKGIDTERYFYGISADLGTYAENWDFNVFAIEQKNAGIIDRRAVGAEVRYYHPGRSLFSLIDYDIFYNELNTLLLVGNWTLPDKTIINSSIDYRKSPTLSTTNALSGQMVDKLSDLLDIWSEEEVRSLAEDRTAESSSFMLGATRPLNEKFQISGDFTVTDITGMPASGGVAVVPGSGHEYFYSVQLIGSGLIKPTDTSIVGLRFSDTSTSDTVSINLNSRYPINRALRVNPRLRFDFSKVHRDGAKVFKVRPSLRADYYWKRRVRFEFEGGMEMAYERVAGQRDDSTDYFLRLGYRAEF